MEIPNTQNTGYSNNMGGNGKLQQNGVEKVNKVGRVAAVVPEGKRTGSKKRERLLKDEMGEELIKKNYGGKERKGINRLEL